MKNIELVRYSRFLGLYKSVCCREELLFDVGDRFAHCPKCAQICHWELVERVVSWQELEDYPDVRLAA